MTKVLAVKYPSSVDRVRQSFDHLRQVFDVPDVSTIKDMFGSLLFNDSALYRYNYCLVKYNNELFIVEPIDLVKQTYVRKKIEYHPLQNMV